MSGSPDPIRFSENIAERIRPGVVPLQTSVGDTKIVMLGEASHGTHEYYTWRPMITQRLIREKCFNFIAVEGE